MISSRLLKLIATSAVALSLATSAVSGAENPFAPAEKTSSDTVTWTQQNENAWQLGEGSIRPVHGEVGKTGGLICGSKLILFAMDGAGSEGRAAGEGLRVRRATHQLHRGSDPRTRRPGDSRSYYRQGIAPRRAGGGRAVGDGTSSHISYDLHKSFAKEETDGRFLLERILRRRG